MASSDGKLSPAAGKAVITVLCLIFISVGLALWIPGFVLPVLEWSKHRKWKPVPCTILKTSFMEAGAGVKVRYEVDGTVYETAIAGDTGFFAGPPLLWRLQEGKDATCYVNPYSPREAVLTRDFDPERFVWCAPLLFVLLPLLALGASLFQRLRPEEAESAPQGSLVLAPRSRRGCGIVMLVVFIGVFAAPLAFLLLLPGFRDDYLLRLVYVVPLGLVVLTLLRILFRTILRAFNPTLILTVTPGEGVPGRPVEVRWEARGSFSGIKRFRLLLEGREEASQAKSSRTVPFAAFDVFQGGARDFKRGLAKVSLPADAMPTLEHGSRRISWVLRLTAEVSVFPDLFEEYAYAVVPRKRGGS